MEVLGATKHGDYNQLEYLSIPQLPSLQPQDVLIKVSYSDVNPVDLQKLHGNQNVGSPVKNNPPFVPGFGGSGIVEEVGSQGPQHYKGKHVCFLASVFASAQECGPSRCCIYSSGRVDRL
jgi:NADPH:quinone reductase-like Zn-dependent oxidoreductase